MTIKTNSTPIVHLDSNNLPKTLPDSHTWETADLGPGGGPGVPVIDLADPDAVGRIRAACERWGAFQVTNHGVAGELFGRMERQMERLFGLPTERKMMAARAAGGGVGYGVPPIAGTFPKLMWSEGFLVIGSPADHARRLWPDTADHDHFIDLMMTYQKELMQLSERLMGLMIESLGLTQEDTKWANPRVHGLSYPEAAVQLNSYPVCPDPTRAMGLVPHTDSSIITLLYQSNGAGGLQVLAEDEERTGWVTVHPINGALVIFVADLMHILSNGRFKSAFHRVVPNSTRNRLSVAFFYGPPTDVEISPLTQLIDANNPPLYRSVTWNEFRGVKKTHLYDAFDWIKIKY